MLENDPKISGLEDRLDRLVRTQIEFQKEVLRIRSELAGLRAGNRIEQEPQPSPPADIPREPIRASDPVRPRPKPRPYPQPERPVSPPKFSTSSGRASTGSSATSESAFSNYVSSYIDSARADLEKFIGENLISKIGILILILGVGIGAKYAIDNGWISPLMRIIFGYVMGFGLLGVAIRLKAKYHDFSAVLLSGGMAIMYFVTYFAYAYYALMPQSAAFVLMAMFTVFTITAAIIYNRQVIAHIGLVGAYAVPFLLSNNSGNYLILFAYMAIINTGILAISVQKYWKPLFYTSSAFTWLIFAGWVFDKFSPNEHFYLALAFLAIFFAIFYATKIVHGVRHGERDDAENLITIFITAFIFYGFCFAIGDVQLNVRAYAAFFTYLAIISLVILLTSYRFYGRTLVYLSYPFTWLIFGNWLLTKYRVEEHFYLAAIFAAVFFAVYYGATIVYRLIMDEARLIENSGLLLTNSFIFYGVGYGLLGSRESLHGLEGIFTAVHSAFHFIVAHVVTRLRASATDIVQVLTILILTFATIAIPVQFDGNYVTLIWSVEAALLFWFGRVRQIWLFEYFSYPLMVFASCSLFADWALAYSERTMYVSEFNRQPIANGDFITALVFVAVFAFIYLTNKDERYEAAVDSDFVKPFGYLVAGFGLLVLYNTFRIEISNYYHLQSVLAATRESNPELLLPAFRTGFLLTRFNLIWQLNYTMFFLIALWAVNIRKTRSEILAFAGVGITGLALAIFTTAAMYLFYELRLAYMTDIDEGRIVFRPMNIAIRYISYAFAAGLLYSIFNYKNSNLLTRTLPSKVLDLGFDAIFYSTVLITASCELINLMLQFHIPDGNKLGLSILWGVYALGLIVIGIALNKQHLRIAAIVLLAVTLIKLFLYDVADLDTIPKTILFVSLGILLLVVSFLYNKYKNIIFKAGADVEEQV